jgi:hypothetical protein
MKCRAVIGISANVSFVAAQLRVPRAKGGDCAAAGHQEPVHYMYTP